MELNFFAATELTRLLLPTMRARAVAISSISPALGALSVSVALPSIVPRSCSEGWSEALRDEVSLLGIRVTIEEPGAFRTGFCGR
jgi:short-subunit dehydrogenase